MKLKFLTSELFQEIMVYWDLINLFCTISVWTLLVLQLFSIQWLTPYTYIITGALALCVLIRYCHTKLVDRFICSRITEEHSNYLNQFNTCEEFSKNVKPALKLQFRHIVSLNICTFILYLFVLQLLIMPTFQHYVELTLLNLQVFLECSKWIIFLFISERFFSFFNLLMIHEEIRHIDYSDFNAIKAIYDDEVDEIEPLQVCLMAAIDDLVYRQK